MYSSKQRSLIVFLCTAFLLGMPFLGRAQQITRVHPSNIAIRGIGMGSTATAIAVGDSAYVIYTGYADTFNPWEQRNTGYPTSVTFDAVAFAGDTMNAVIAGTQGALAWTSDTGATWHHVSVGTTGTIRALAYSYNNGGIAQVYNTTGAMIGVGDGGLIIRSTDQGHTWSTITSGTTEQLNAISFGSPSEAIAVGNDTTILQSHDSGKTWTPMKFPYDLRTAFGGIYNNVVKKINFTAVVMGLNDSIWVALEGPSPIPPLLIDNGAAKQDLVCRVVTGYANPPASLNYSITSLAYVNIPGYMNVAAFTSSDVILVDTGGQGWYVLDWYQFGGDADGGVAPAAIHTRGVGYWITETYFNFMMGGDDLMIYPFVQFGPRNDIYPFAPFFYGLWLPGRGDNYMCYLDLDISQSGLGYSCGLGLEERETTDGGFTWSDYLPSYDTSLNTNSYSFDCVHTLNNGNAIFTGWDGLIFYYDPLDTPKCQIVPTGTQERLEGITFPTSDTAFNVGDFGSVFRTTDEGLTWNPINTPTSEYLYSVAFANNEIGVAAGNDGEIIRTTDNGNTWAEVNSILTGTSIDIRGLQGFPDGTFLARAGNELLRSTDFGQNWLSILPSSMSDTDGMSFYSPQIGIIAEQPTSSANCPDTAHLAYTRDGGATWTQFAVPIINYYRILFHWVNDHEVLIYGCLGIIDDIVLSTNGVQVARVDDSSAIQVYPNPSNGSVQVSYTAKTNGPVSIGLYDETGRLLMQMFNGQEIVGDHVHSFDLSKITQGSYYIRLTHEGKTSTSPVSVE